MEIIIGILVVALAVVTVLVVRFRMTHKTKLEIVVIKFGSLEPTVWLEETYSFGGYMYDVLLNTMKYKGVIKLVVNGTTKIILRVVDQKATTRITITGRKCVLDRAWQIITAFRTQEKFAPYFQGFC